jgi:SAM-dependent methyltransferase
MKIPNSCLTWLKLQRSGYRDHKKEFIYNMNKEYYLMDWTLPYECNSIIDIGCGIGGIDVLLSQKYNNPKIFLLDKSEKKEKVIYGYNRGESFYNSLDATNDMMIANDVLNYKLIDLEKDKLNVKDHSIDLVISLLSCGYHYPVEEYLEQIEKWLSKNGKLIIDLREGTEGFNTVRHVFPDIDVISSYNKSIRVCASRGK